MKRLLLYLLPLCLIAPLASVRADVPELRYIEHDDGIYLIDLLPRVDGGLLLCGYTYTKNAVLEGFVGEGEQIPLRTDAYAVALDAEGREEWRLRIGDPEAINCFSAAAPVWDGDFVLTYQATLGTWGTQHYIVSPDGAVKEMLPSSELREKGLLYTLRPVGDGFLGGGYETRDGIGLEPMVETRRLQWLDRNMTEVWRLEDPSLFGCLFESASAGEDGFALCGAHYTVSNSGYSTEGSVLLRLDPKGLILWQKKLPAPEDTWIADVLMIPGGELLVCGSGDPGEPSNVLPGGTLSKFDREGNRLWTKGYHFTYGLYMLSGVAPLGDGFAVTDGMAGTGVFYVDADGEVLGRYRPPVVDNAGLTIFPAPDGDLYVLGNIATPTDEITDGVPVNRSFYVKLSVSDFTPVQR